MLCNSVTCMKRQYNIKRTISNLNYPDYFKLFLFENTKRLRLSMALKFSINSNEHPNWSVRGRIHFVSPEAVKWSKFSLMAEADLNPKIFASISVLILSS